MKKSSFMPIVEEVPLSEIKPYEKNAKKHSPRQVSDLAKQIDSLGYDVPIVIDQEGYIIKGHARFLALKKLKKKVAPVIRRTDLTEDQVKAARLADNKLAESEWDMNLVSLELTELLESGFELDLTGFDIDDLGLDDEEKEKKDDDEPDEGIYTWKVEAPIYKPKGERPPEKELYSLEKTNALLEKIDTLEAPPEVLSFLRNAAQRHTVFNYEKIAEYYCHAPKEVQELMEDSALVIIDFKKAIKHGFVKLTKALAEARDDDESL